VSTSLTPLDDNVRRLQQTTRARARVPRRCLSGRACAARAQRSGSEVARVSRRAPDRSWTGKPSRFSTWSADRRGNAFWAIW